MNFIQSVHGETDEITEALQLGVYVDELKRQAIIANRSLTRGWLRAMQPETHPHDPAVWGELQSALFAAIVVYRILRPGSVHPFPKETKRERQQQADRRSQQLQELLGIDDDFAVFKVRDVRNKFEHFDERLDAAVMAGRSSLIDWHISRDGTSFLTPEGYDGPVVEPLRVFYPKAGTLYFGEVVLDLYAMDCALLTLRDDMVPAATERLTEIRGNGQRTFGASTYINLMNAQRAQDRMDEWLRVRAEGGSPIPFSPSDVSQQRHDFRAAATASPSSGAL